MSGQLDITHEPEWRELMHMDDKQSFLGRPVARWDLSWVGPSVVLSLLAVFATIKIMTLDANELDQEIGALREYNRTLVQDNHELDRENVVLKDKKVTLEKDFNLALRLVEDERKERDALAAPSSNKGIKPRLRVYTPEAVPINTPRLTAFQVAMKQAER